MNAKKNQQSQNTNKKSNHYIWQQKIEGKPLDIEENIKIGRRKKLDNPLFNIDEEKYPMIHNKLNNNEAKKDESKKEMKKRKVDSKLKASSKGKNEKPPINTDLIIEEMKEKNREMIYDNANFVINNIDIFNFKDKRNLDFKDTSKFNFQTYKYINDKILPQIIQIGLKNKGSGHLKSLHERAEADSNVRKYCKELEDKIENDIELKLSDNYYEQKNKHIQNIFQNKPKNYYEKKAKSRPKSNEARNQQESLEKKIKLTGSPDKRYNQLGNPQVSSTAYNHNYGKGRKHVSAPEKTKGNKANEHKVEYDKLYKETVENILTSIGPKNIMKYINSSIMEKSSNLFILISNS